MSKKLILLSLLSSFCTPLFAIDLITLDGKPTKVESLHRSDMWTSDQPYTYENYVALTSAFENEYRQESGATFIGTPTYLLYAPGGKLVGTHTGLLQRKQLEAIVGPAEEKATYSTDLIQ